VADVTDASLPEIVALNPSLLRMSTPSNMGFDLHLPAGTRDVYLKRVANIPEDKRTSWRFHVVRPGESLDSIAASLHGRSSEIATANGVAASASIDAGDELVVPVTSAIATALAQHYVTRAGDTLVTVADRFNVSVEDLRRWNHLSSSTIKPHRTLDVAEPVHLAPQLHVRARGTHAAASTHATASLHGGVNAHAKASVHAGIHAQTMSATGSAKSPAKTPSRSAATKNTLRSKRRNPSR
jgi:membrane-bound lytic murein transglycosylase D